MTQPVRIRREFTALPGGGYVLALPDDGVRVEVRHLRRSFQQLQGEVEVFCEWFDALTDEDHCLSCADLNLSSQRDRTGRAEYCQRRAKVTGFDWAGLLDDFCRRVIQAERQTSNAIVLDDAPDDGPPPDFEMYGLSLPADSHSQLICDGGGLKSLILLLVLGTLALRGIPTLFLDWEWNASRHKARKRRLFGAERIEHLHYLRCRNPITIELDHIRRTCESKQIQFIGIDSISAAAPGKLGDDDVARAYNRALDYLPPGVAAAHITKSNSADPTADLKAFGSAFFHNYARCTYSVKKQIGANPNIVTVVLTPHKENDGAGRRAVGLEFSFGDQIDIRTVDAGSVAAYTASLPLKDQITRLLAGGAMTITEIATQLDAKSDSVQKAIRRELGDRFIKVVGPNGIDRYALLERRAA